MNYILYSLLILTIIATHYQTGIDQHIHDQPSLSQASSYPLHSNSPIEFQHPFPEVPEVLIMHEHLLFESSIEVDINVEVQSVTQNGFTLAYRLSGPARVHNLRIRWVAFVDKNTKLIYKEFSFMQLKELRQGTGQRTDSFKIDFQVKTPMIATFLVGFKINPENGPYSIQLQQKEQEEESFILALTTRDNTKIRFAKVAILLTNAQTSSLFLKEAGVDAQGFNYFEDRSSSGIRRIDYELPLPQQIGQDILFAQGIRGFDANSTQSSFISMSLDNYHIDKQSYLVNFGPMNETIIYNLDISILMHPKYQAPETVKQTRALRKRR